VTVLFLTAFSQYVFAEEGEQVKNEQIKITEKIPLLDENGKVIKPGYCFTNMYEYDRKAIKANPTRIKEWDFYQISNSRYCLQVTMADISLGGAASLTLFDMQTGERYSATSLQLLTFGRFGLSKDAMTPHTMSRHKLGFDIDINVTESQRTIKYEGRSGFKKFTVDLSMDMFPNHESLVMALPFNRGNDKQFYLNQKVNSMPVTGTVTVGDLVVKFDPSDSFCVLDWGRGVWPYHENWYWGNGTTRLENGDLFGFEIGWGFGDMSAATENTLFYNGKAHKIGEVYLTEDKFETKNWMTDWVFTSSDGRFEMTMTPIFDNITKARVLFVGNICHQVFGLWNGKVTLDDGTVLEIHNMVAFCEDSDNMW
ncbi:MAG: DUF2804 domain-containing protein, partial [Ruminococcus sp.]|nr:DUF2804 domain-containing protein [Candidatus Copronaster equi]